jgi:hypothetical protein
VKDSLRRMATAALTGTPGRLFAFVVDVGAASARYYSARLRGRETPW